LTPLPVPQPTPAEAATLPIQINTVIGEAALTALGDVTLTLFKLIAAVTLLKKAEGTLETHTSVRVGRIGINWRSRYF
jgi:hypothetical protein